MTREQRLEIVVRACGQFLRAWQPDEPGPMARYFGRMISPELVLVELDAAEVEG